MTTVAFDGVTLAVDSQTTQLSGIEGHCPSCDDHITRTHRYGYKLCVPRAAQKIHFKDQEVVAWSGTGMSKIIGAATRALRRGFDLLEALELIRAYANHMGDSEIIIVTAVTVWQLSVSQKETKVIEVTKYPAAWGSGCPAARLAMNRLGLSAPAAVALAIDSDTYSGGAVRYTDCRNDVNGEIQSYTYTEEDILELINTNKE